MQTHTPSRRILSLALPCIVLMGLLVFPTMVDAQPVFDSNGIVDGINQASNIQAVDPNRSLPELINTIKDRAIGLVAFAAAITIVIAGMYLILGLGNDDSKDKAKKIIQYTAIGIGVISFAGFVAPFLYDLYGDTGYAGGMTQARNKVGIIVNNTLGLLALASAITIIIAGLYLIFSNGEDEAKDRAKKIVYYTLAGLFLILVSRVIVGFVINLL